MKFYAWILIFLLIISFSCEKWNYEKRPDHDFVTFEKTYDFNSDDDGRCIICTNDGGFAILGKTINSGNTSTDVLLIKIDKNGNVIWSISNFTWMISSGIDHNEEGVAIEQTSDNGFIIAGSREESGKGKQIYLVKTDENGCLEWEKEFGLDDYNEECYSFAQNNLNYLVLGYQEHPASGFKNAVIYKTDFSGTDDLRYTISLNTGLDDYGCYIKRTTDESFYVLLNLMNNDPKYDTYLFELNNDLQVISDTIPVGTDCVNNNCSFLQTTDGGFAIISTIRNNNKCETRLVITNSEGLNPIVKTYNDSDAELGASIAFTNDGGFIILTSGLILIKTNDNGAEQWRKDFEGNSYGNNAVMQTDDGGYIFTGQKLNPTSNNHDVYIVKTDMNGVVR